MQGICTEFRQKLAQSAAVRLDRTRQDLPLHLCGGGGLGVSVAYDTAINIIAAYETIKFGNGDGAAAAERAARYERADLLIIDDMGTEMGTAFTVSALYNLINNRLMAHRPMIVNTNLLPDELKKRYSPAVASRLLGEFKQLRFFGDDIRMLKSRMQNR